MSEWVFGGADGINNHILKIYDCNYLPVLELELNAMYIRMHTYVHTYVHMCSAIENALPVYEKLIARGSIQRKRAGCTGCTV